MRTFHVQLLLQAASEGYSNHRAANNRQAILAPLN